tara:strand:+ start:981 stop:1568 length:588 start_codon:yes stop_codon:yes gene_type:complete
MGVLRGPDFFYSLRFLRLLTMPWEKTAAFKEGIIDKNGKKLKKAETPAEKSAYNVFHKLVFNIRRLLAKAPGGSSAIAKYATALFLIKDHLQLSNKALSKTLREAIDVDFMEANLHERTNAWYLTEDKEKIQASKYALNRDIALPKTGELLAKKNSWVKITEHAPIGDIFGIPVFEALHLKTQQKIYIVQEDIVR